MTADMDKREKWIKVYGAVAKKARALAYPQPEVFEPMVAMRKEYLPTLEQVAVSRCPFCKAMATMSWDPIGLDGPWWSYWYPSREKPAPLCEHFMAIVGAVTLPERPPFTPSLVKPGPGAPFVVPALITGMGYYDLIEPFPENPATMRASAGSRPTVRAVISKLKVGGMPAYAIHYFGNPVTPALASVQSWSADDWGDSLYVRPCEAEEESPSVMTRNCEFELRPWLDEGFVQWIAPGDETLTLQTSTANCPYLDVPGARKVQYLQSGNLWF